MFFGPLSSTTDLTQSAFICATLGPKRNKRVCFEAYTNAYYVGQLWIGDQLFDTKPSLVET